MVNTPLMPEIMINRLMTLLLLMLMWI